MQGTTFLSFFSVSFGISFEHAVQLPFTVFLYSPFPDNYAFLSLSPSQIKNIQSADTVPVHGHSPLVISRRALAREGDYEMMPVCACVRACVRALVSHADSSKTTTATDFL